MSRFFWSIDAISLDDYYGFKLVLEHLSTGTQQFLAVDYLVKSDNLGAAKQKQNSSSRRQVFCNTKNDMSLFVCVCLFLEKETTRLI